MSFYKSCVLNIIFVIVIMVVDVEYSAFSVSQCRIHQI